MINNSTIGWELLARYGAMVVGFIMPGPGRVTNALVGGAIGNGGTDFYKLTQAKSSQEHDRAMRALGADASLAVLALGSDMIGRGYQPLAGMAVGIGLLSPLLSTAILHLEPTRTR